MSISNLLLPESLENKTFELYCNNINCKEIKTEKLDAGEIKVTGDLEITGEIKVDTIDANVIQSNLLTGENIVANTKLETVVSNGIINYTTPNLGQPNFSLHTDGIGGTFWSPDDTGAGDIVYDGALPLTPGTHTLYSSNDGIRVGKSKLLETTTDLFLNNLNLNNAGTIDMNGSLKITSTTPSLELKNTLANPSSGTIRFTDQLDNPKATIKLKSDGGIEVLNNTDILFRIIPPTLNTNIFTNFSVNNYTQPDTNIYMTADNGALNHYYETATSRYVHQVVDTTKSFGLGNDVKGTIYQYDYNNDTFNFEKKVLTNQTLPADFTNPNEFISKTYADTKLSKTEPNIQVLTGDIQIPMGETSALVGQNLYDLNSTSNELLGKTVNIDISTFTDYTKLNGNTQTGLLTVKRDDLAPTSANTFEIKNAYTDAQIYAIDGLGHNVGSDLVLKHQVDGSYVRIRSQTLSSVRGIYNNYGGVERPIITWTNTSTSNTGAVLIHSNNAEIIRINTNADASTRTIIIKGTSTTVEGTTVSIKDPATTKAINLKFSGINAGIYSFGVAPYATELPVLTWGNNDGGAGTTNTNWVFLHSAGLEIMRVKTTLPSQKEITFQGTTTTFNGNVLIPGTINSLTPVGGKFSQYVPSSISNTTEERSMFATGGIGSRIFLGNTFALGDTYKITIGSVVSSTSTPNITLRFKLGGELLTSVVIEAHNVPSVPNTPLNTDIQFNITSLGTSGALYIQGKAFLGSTMTHILSNIATIDTTSPNTLEITAQWTAANISNTLTTLTINVFKIY